MKRTYSPPQVTSRGTCYAEDCLNPVDGHGLCSTHRKRQARGTPLSAPKLDRTRSHLEVALDASIALADADTSDDAAWGRAKDNWRKAVIAYARRELAAAIAAGLRRRARAGLSIGRPARLSHQEATAAVERSGGVRAAARELGVARSVVTRALRRS